MKQKYCKRLAAVVMLLACSLYCSAQVEFLDRYKEAEGVRYTYISKYALDNMDLEKISFPSQDFTKLKGKLSSIQNLSSTASASNEILAEVEAFVKKEKYELVVMQSAKKAQSMSASIYFREQTGKSSMFIVKKTGQSLHVIVLEGTFTLRDFMEKNAFYYQ